MEELTGFRGSGAGGELRVSGLTVATLGGWSARSFSPGRRLALDVHSLKWEGVGEYRLGTGPLTVWLPGGLGEWSARFVGSGRESMVLEE